MTRSTLALHSTLALLWSLVIVWLLTGHLQADAPPSVPPPSATSLTPPWPGNVTGYGQTLPDARHDALRQAVKEVENYVSRLDPPLHHWRPTVPFVETHLLVDNGRPGNDVDIKDLGRAKSWILTLRTPDPAQLAQLERTATLAEREHQRHSAARSRVLLTGRLFLMTLAALCLVFGSNRLGDRTGTRTRLWHRLATIAAALAAAGFIWLNV